MKRSGPSFGQLIWLGTLLLNLIIFSIAGIVVSENRKAASSEARLLTENYARILKQNIAGFVKQIDITLLNVIDEIDRQRNHGGIKTPEFEAFLARQDARIPDSLGLRIGNADGLIIHAVSNVQITRVSIADRPYYTYLRDEPNAGLLISPPLAGRTSLKPVVIFARRLNNPDGTFAGTAHVAVPVDYFITQFSRLDLGQQGNTGFWTKTNLIARYSKADPAGAKTGASTPSPQLRALLDSDLVETSYQATSGIDGISRIYRFNRVEPYDLFLLVGLADEDYLADWKRDSLRTAVLVLLFLVVTLFFARLAYFNWQRREQAQAELNSLNETLLRRKEDAEAARQQSELILDSAGEGICGVDTQGKITFINRSARQMFGWNENEGIGANLHALAHHHHADGRDFPVSECPIFMTIQDGKTRQVNEDCYWRRDGTFFAVEHTVAALEQDGQITGAVNVFRDISERKRNEAELEAYRKDLEALVKERTDALMEIEARASSLLDSSAGGLYGIDQDGAITFINPAACAMLGYTPEQVIGRSAHTLFHHHHADGSEYPVADCPSYSTLRLGQRVRVDNEIYWHADGHAIAVIYATHPMETNGRITGAVTSLVDISDQRAAAEAREHALLAAENLARVRSEFLANMSHEIRTPLNGVLGFAEIGQRNYLNSEKARDAFSKIITSGKRLLGVINDILDFSKIEAGKLNIEQTEVFLPELINQTLEIVADRAHAKKLELTVELAPDLPKTCISDPLRIGQVLLNVMANAVKFTEAGSITLSVRLDNDRLHFKITDTGIGMSEKQLGELFNAFQQADASATRRFGGTGLGLAISKRILELMGGDILVESQLGIGSVFEFHLPYIQPTKPAALPAPASAPSAVHKPLAGLSILAAEDEPINQAALEENLSEDGAQVTMVSNGREAVQHILHHGGDAYDIVLMDLQMPEMDGYEATRRILEMAPDLPIVAQTAHAFGEEREKCLAAGMVGHIAKPIDPDELVGIVLLHARHRQKS
ncbi:MAG: PAS domain S-box protein [Azonexus sp.]|nr:PAS domain S-box protein [Azonexus sp.]